VPKTNFKVFAAMRSIYLDNNATTPLRVEVAAAIAQCYAAGYANPASAHAAGRRARQVLEDAREGIARILGVDLASRQRDRLIFTSGGTEANNLAIFGLAGGAVASGPKHAVISAIEHPSVVAPAEVLATRGWRLDRLGVARDGVVHVDQFPDLLRDDTSFVSLMLGNNETGVLQPVEQAARLCAMRGVPLHTDAVQAAGKVAVDFRGLGAAAMSVSAHKFHGPPGIGALAVRHGVSLAPVLYGGFQQEGLRPGTEPVALIVGFHAALDLWHREQAAVEARLRALREKFESSLLAACPELVVNGATAPRLPHTSNVAFPGLDRQALLMALDLAGVACSTGSACASGSSEPSPTLVAMGCEKAIFEGSLRFSFGALTSDEDVDEAVRRILLVYNDLRAGRSSRKMPATRRGQNAISL
jgi:cysteine desulfurase